MTDGMGTIIVSVVGIVATLIASALGLYFSARARTAPLRHLLYEKQLELVTEFMTLIGKARTYSVLLADPSRQFFERAREDLGEVVPRLSQLCDVAAAILSTDVYVEVNRLQSAVTSFLADCDEGRIDEEFPKKLAAQAAKTALLVRSSLGIDELSEESLKLFGSTKGLQRLANLTLDDVRTTVKGKT